MLGLEDVANHFVAVFILAGFLAAGGVIAKINMMIPGYGGKLGQILSGTLMFWVRYG